MVSTIHVRGNLMLHDHVILMCGCMRCTYECMSEVARLHNMTRSVEVHGNVMLPDDGELLYGCMLYTYGRMSDDQFGQVVLQTFFPCPYLNPYLK